MEDTLLVYIMQSSLCLRAACPVNANNQHPYVLRGLPDRSQLALNSSPLFSRRIINPCMRGHTTPPKADINKKDEVTGIGQLKSVAAAVVMTCTLGAMCTGQKAMARRIDLFRSPPSITSESDHAPAEQKLLASIDLLLISAFVHASTVENFASAGHLMDFTISHEPQK